MLVTRSRSYFIAILAILSMVAASVSGLAPAAARDLGPMPDLPAMLLRTSDIADAGVADQYFPSGGTCRTSEQDAMVIASSRSLDPLDVQAQYDDMGLSRSCGQPYGLPPAPGSTEPPIRTITSYVRRFEDAAGADLGFEFLEDETGNPDAEDLTEASTIGDMSEMSLVSGSNSIGDYQMLDLTFLYDNLVAGVQIHDFTGETPDPETVELLAESMLDRIDMVLDGDGPGLGAMALQMEGEGLPPTNLDRYLMIDGEAEMSARETEEQFEQRIDGYDRAEAVFTSTQTIPVGNNDDNADDFLYGLNLYLFPSERAASRYLQDAPERYGETPEVFDVVTLDDAPQFGDESLSMRNGQTLGSGQDVVNDRTLVRVGTIVINIGFRGAELPEGISEEIVEAQIACVEDGYCASTVSVPAALMGEIAQDTTAPASDPAGKASKGLRPATQDAYTSELYPYTFGYSDEWVLEEPQIIGDTEILSMSNGSSGIVIITSTSHSGDVAACLDGALAYIEDDPEIEDITIMEDESGVPIEGTDGDRAFAAYSYVPADGGEMALYAECRVIVPGEVTLEFNQFVALDDFESEVDARSDLLDGLNIDE